MKLFHYYDLSFSEIFIFDDYMINQMREGEEITPNHNYVLRDLVKKHFTNKKIIYISNRVTNYAVNPLVYKEVEKIPNLVAMIIIANKETSRKNAEYEKGFFNRPFKICNNLTEAIMWVDKLIYNKNS
ncbi:hypothetical protein [uncultured Lacinutrix sp.]|uniref:hypothetical protein n=1 Tax=uncultured Lacinutrix sp. TaxID=574032 RepID=UPI0026235F02|nr:hypothetical protein [uncultured Lacinutrix sp.]